MLQAGGTRSDEPRKVKRRRCRPETWRPYGDRVLKLKPRPNTSSQRPAPTNHEAAAGKLEQAPVPRLQQLAARWLLEQGVMSHMLIDAGYPPGQLTALQEEERATCIHFSTVGSCSTCRLFGPSMAGTRALHSSCSASTSSSGK